MSKKEFLEALMAAAQSDDVDVEVHDMSGRHRRGEGEEDYQGGRIMPEAAIHRMTEWKERYLRGAAQFKVGDVVQPMRDSNIKGHGRPHMVIDVLEKPYFNFTGNADGCHFGQRIDMRVLVIIKDKAIPFWVESWQYEPWKESA